MLAAFKYFVYGSWWVAICAACMGLVSWFEFTSSWWNAPLFIFIIGSTLVVYNLNMLSGLEELREKGTDSERHHWCLNNETLMKITLLIGLVLSMISIWWLNKTVWLLLIPLTFIAIAYAAPIIRKKTEKIRIREIGIWKIFIIAVVWAGVTVILPAVDLYGLNQFQEFLSWQLAIERGIFILAITIPFDVRDLVNDAKKGVQTIPSIVGVFRSVLLAITLLALFLFLLWWRLDETDALFKGYLLSTLVTMFAVSFANPKRSDMYCSFLIEGTMALMFLAVWLI